MRVRIAALFVLLALVVPAGWSAPPARGRSPVATAAAAAAPILPDPPAGIYQVWARLHADAAQPYIKAGQIVVHWRDVEPARGRYDWTKLDALLAQYRSMGKRATVQVDANTKPAWLWDHVARCGTANGYEVPQYWDPLYFDIQQQLVNAFTAHLKGSPDVATVALVRASPNALGTELTEVPKGYTCTPATSGRISGVAWTAQIGREYYLKIMGAYRTASSPELPFALRVQLFNNTLPPPPLDWLGVDDAWVFGTASDIDANPTRDAYDVFAKTWAGAGKTQAYWEPHHTKNKNHLVSWNYWRLLLELHKGVSYVAVYGQELRNGTLPEYRAAFDFVNRYAGSHTTPDRSPGAWVALKLGPGRMAGNFSRFMTQLNPETTSTPLDSNNGGMIVGPTTQRFGRHARRIDGGTSKNRMYFQLDPAFRASIATSATKVRVVYLDRGTGQLRLSWGTTAGTSRTVTKTNTGAWKELLVDVPGSALRGLLSLGSDLTVTALGTDSSIVHMVEVQVPGR